MKNKQVFRLAGSYLAVIMTISIFFSVVIFAIFSANISKKPPTLQNREQDFYSEVGASEIFENRLTERHEYAKTQIIFALIIMNSAIFGLGVFLSVWLARWTLRPIEENLELQRQFISDASHEIRTPLAAMLVSNEIALRKKVLTEEKSRQILSKNVDEIQNLSNLAENLLNLTSSKKNAIKKSKINSKDLLLGVAEKVISKADLKKIKIDILGEDFYFNENAAGLGQILTIFADNAVKYSPEKSSVKFSSKKDKKCAIFEIIDEGDGVSKEEQGKIFERFYRIDSARTRCEAEKSHGLGLAIAKKIAEQNGFEIFVESRQGEGSKFGVKIKI